ncbi:hypothetical protein C7T35_10090 [Variovorax sp. WS11]|uniref:hypothetical protein n=1 Tax=Variovorax sp. WS11 TaxID=1105204 RepID=UPI000D0CD444|nr:hypothetical protein [Variovorax sp. WS11]NDZ12701.1 hypothetical protein [Variovorax sp. WS11]PSL84645.1 hypothetical protein C7T35_10090 [Variovorax sp. WS11]
MFDHGMPVTMAANQLAIDGSPLLAYIVATTAAEAGTLTVTPREVPALLKLRLSEPDTSQVSAFDDMPGTIKVGRKSMTFAGSNCGGILQASFRKLFDDGASLTDGQFWADIAQWDGRDIRSLPYHDKLVTLYKMLGEGWHLEFVLEMEGREILRGNFNGNDPQHGYVGALNTLFAYSMRARAIATHMNEVIAFRSDVSFTKEEHRALGDAVEVFDLKRVHGREEQISNPRCRLVAAAAALDDLLKRTSTPAEVMISSEDRELIKIFNQFISLPPVEVWLKAVVPKIISNRRLRNDPRKDQNEKRELRIEFEPADGYQCMVRYGSSTKVT